MLKTTITLRNGATVQVECDTTNELVDLLSTYETGVTVKPEVAETEVRNDVRAVTHVNSPLNQLGEKEILLIVSKLAEANGNVSQVVDFMVNNTKSGKSRFGIQAIVSRIKMYMYEGKTRGTGISRYVKTVLRTNAIKPGVYSHPGKPMLKMRKRPSPIQWSDRDIEAIANIVRTNLHQVSGISKLVRRYVQTLGDEKNRTQATIYAITSEIKRYLKTGKQGNMSKNIKDSLDKASIFPNTQSNYLGEVPRAVVQEA